MADEMLNGSSPWWVKAPIWLGVGIVGVPSLIAIMCLVFLFYLQPQALKENNDQTRENIRLMTVAVENNTQVVNRLVTALTEANSNNATSGVRIQRWLDLQSNLQAQTCVNAAKSSDQTRRCLDLRNPVPAGDR